MRGDRGAGSRYAIERRAGAIANVSRRRCLRSTALDDVLDFLGIEFLAVLFGQDAAQKLDDLRRDVRSRQSASGIFVGVSPEFGGLAAAVELERVEGRDLVFLVRGNRREARDDAGIRLLANVLAAVAAALGGLVDDVAGRERAGRELQAVGLRRDPLETVGVFRCERDLRDERSLAEAFQGWEQAVVRCGRHRRKSRRRR